jgi:molybdate transport system substrate-binding protein
MRVGRIALVVAALLLGRGLPARADEVTVFAAASLADVLGEVGRTFEAASGHHVVFNFGGSNDLARQIEAGAPADLFLSADRAQMDRLEKAGLVRADRRVDLLSNQLVVVVPSSSTERLTGPAELARLPRIALADPEAVPAGVYARTYLESLGLWPAMRERVVPTLDVRAALAAVESGNVSAGIVYRTDAALSKRVRVAFEVPRASGPRIVYVLAPIGVAPRPAARALLSELRSARAARVYEKDGFVVLATP